MENRRSVLELTDGKTKLSDDATNIIADGLTKLLGHYDNWVTVEAKKKKKKNVPKNKSKTDVSNFTTTGIVCLMSMKIGSFYFKSPLYKQIDHPVPIAHWICCLICTELLQ